MKFGEKMSYEVKEKIWSLLYPAGDGEAERATEEISASLGISKTCAKLMYNRGYKNSEAARRLLDSDIDMLHDPYLMKDMRSAVDRINLALERGERITVYGDYDVDGVTAVSLIYLYLKSLGASVDYYIPSRSKEGYGLSHLAIDTLHAKGTQLIVTVDTGITANEEAEYAKDLGIEMVITDHHECHGEIPCAEAVVNPHRPDCTYPFCELAGVGVIFKVVCAIEISRHPEKEVKEAVKTVCDEYIDLVAIGTVADVMPLCDENRVIVREGIEKMTENCRVGIVALMDAASNSSGNSRPAIQTEQTKKKRTINAGYIGFGIAPRINAAGRISSASRAVELLLCRTYDEAYPVAEELCEINLRRQIEENSIAEQAYKMIEQTHDFEHDKVIVLEDDSWQQGIVGIVSSRITEKYGLPSILISFDGATRGYSSLDDMGKGSGRSIKGMNLVDALGYCDDLLSRYGGHELAAGLTVMRCNVDEFRRRINEYAAAHLTDEHTKIRYEADCELSLSEADMRLAEEISCLEPFGVSNPTPLFVFRNLLIEKISAMGSGKHSKLILSDGKNIIHAVDFGTSPESLGVRVGDRVDILCKLNINEYRGVCSLQLVLQDVEISEESLAEIDRAEKRYREIIGGDALRADDDILPTRDDVGALYRLLKTEGALGRKEYGSYELYSALRTSCSVYISYLKFRFMIDILREMKVCEISDIEGGFFAEICENAEKTNMEASQTYRRLLEERG